MSIVVVCMSKTTQAKKKNQPDYGRRVTGLQQLLWKGPFPELLQEVWLLLPHQLVHHPQSTQCCIVEGGGQTFGGCQPQSYVQVELQVSLTALVDQLIHRMISTHPTSIKGTLGGHVGPPPPLIRSLYSCARMACLVSLSLSMFQ